jgi:4-amino-4-deoxy-L-arabinose transferase-like glycosyltransferase
LLTLAAIFFGSLFTLAVAFSLGAFLLRPYRLPATIKLGFGAVLLSGIVFLMLLVGAANPVTFGLVGVVSIGLALFRRQAQTPALPWRTRFRLRVDPVTGWLLIAILACYGVLYLVNALAPEIQPDGYTYHLGLVSEYARLGRFTPRIGFFEMLPHGLEMLFLFAFAFGKHSAAKLVHFGFLVATFPLIVSLGRRLKVTDAVSAAASVLYLCAPVVGISGTCSYNDAALVFFTLATFYVLLAWHDEKNVRYLMVAGLLAGFCYAIKVTGLLTVVLAIFFVLVNGTARDGYRNLIALTATALLAIAPWMLRAAILTGNPFAPVLNKFFPNPYFRSLTEAGLAQSWRYYQGFSLSGAPKELLVGGRLQGIFGPVCILLPFGLIALRSRAARICWLSGTLLAIPWFTNAGARFLMPSLPFFALALAMALPKPVAWACMAFHAISVWPYLIPLYQPGYIWRLGEFPWRAALRIQPEVDYLQQTLLEYQIVEMVQNYTKPGAKIFSLMAVPTAYTDRESLVWWHSALGERLADTLRMPSEYPAHPLYNVHAQWPAQPLRGVRFRLPLSNPAEWCIREVRLYLGQDQVFGSPQWVLSAWPNPWEAPIAFDNNVASRWRTWEPMQRGMYLEARFDRPQMLTEAELVSHAPVYNVPMEFYTLGADGKWLLVSDSPATELRPKEDLRKAATRSLKHAGIDYILTPANNQNMGRIGAKMAGHETEWGLEDAEHRGDVYLFRIVP